MTKPATVYIVDDDESTLKPISKVVEAIGLKPEAFSSPEEFLDKYHPNGPACLVLDIMMPGMSGVAIQQRLAEVGITLPTIVISAYADVRLAVQVMRNGARTLLEKPFRHRGKIPLGIVRESQKSGNSWVFSQEDRVLIVSI
ncbi:MAG: response regulator, partial [Planctomycetes bacterium]|nr:response regulator [Planctomycetota bacterium]